MENYFGICSLRFGIFFGFCLAGRVVCLFHGDNRCIPWLPFIFQTFKTFFGCSVCFSPVFLALNDFVLFLPFLDVFPATCIHVITSGMDGSVLFAVVFIVHRLC